MEVEIEENAEIRFGAEIPEQFLFSEVVFKIEIIWNWNILLCQETLKERFQGEIR